MSLRRALKHLLPGALLLAAAVAIPHVPSLWRLVLELLPVYFSLVFVGGLLLAWQFDRSRVALTLLALALADRALPPGGPNVREPVALLLPINLAAFSWLKERGLLTPRGFIKVGALLLQALAVAALARAHALAAVSSWVSHPLVGWPAQAAVPLPQLALAAGLLSAGRGRGRFRHWARGHGGGLVVGAADRPPGAARRRDRASADVLLRQRRAHSRRVAGRDFAQHGLRRRVDRLARTPGPQRGAAQAGRPLRHRHGRHRPLQELQRRPRARRR